MFAEFLPALHGALAFPITPYTPNGDVDLEAVRANARIYPGSGVSAIVAPSGTGEIFALTPGEVNEIVAATVDVAGDVPVIAPAGIGPRLGAEMAAAAERAGAKAIMVIPPYYANPDPGGLVQYSADIAAGSSLPILPYARDAARFTPATLESLVNRVPQVVGFKDGRADVRLFQQLRDHVNATFGDDRMVWIGGSGDDLVGPYFAAGAVGFTSSLACFWPEGAAELFQLASTHDVTGLAAFYDRAIRPIYAMRQRRPGYEVSVMKTALDLLGYVAGPSRAPLANLTDAERDELAGILEPLNIPTAADRGIGA